MLFRSPDDHDREIVMGFSCRYEVADALASDQGHLIEEQPREEVVDVRDDSRARPEVGDEPSRQIADYLLARCRIEAYVGATEGVNRLLRVADEKESPRASAAFWLREQQEHLDL